MMISGFYREGITAGKEATDLMLGLLIMEHPLVEN
jgi:hypothetical protein